MRLDAIGDNMVLFRPFVRNDGLRCGLQCLTVTSNAGANKRNKVVDAGHIFVFQSPQSSAANRLPMNLVKISGGVTN